MFDIREAGKALAYDLPTDCGYHVFRATESVLRRYYATVSGNAPKPKVRSVGVYVAFLRQRKSGDEKVLMPLDQMAKLHRNPLIHPEVALSMDEALAILGIARSAVTAMLLAIVAEPATTNNVQ